MVHLCLILEPGTGKILVKILRYLKSITGQILFIGIPLYFNNNIEKNQLIIEERNCCKVLFFNKNGGCLSRFLTFYIFMDDF